MRVRLLAFGKLKTPGLREAADHYARLIRPWLSLHEAELRPERVDGKSPAARKQVQRQEATTLSRAIDAASDRRAVVLLDEGGKPLATKQWAELLRDFRDRGVQDACFCVGSSLGFAPEIRALAEKTLSLGPHTLPHELARVVLLEQLYRAMSVVQGHPYHNEGG